MTPFTHEGGQYRQAPGPGGAIDKQNADGTWTEVPSDDPIYGVRAAAANPTPPVAASTEPAPAAPAPAPSNDEPLTKDVIARTLAQYPAYKGFTYTGAVPLTTKQSIPSNTPYAQPTTKDVQDGRMELHFSNPNGGPNVSPGVTITITRDGDTVDETNGKPHGNWTVIGEPAEIRATGTAQKPAEQVQAETDTAKANAVKERAAADLEIAKGSSTGKQLAADDQQRQFNWEQHGMWMTHAEYATYMQSTDSNARANAKVTADNAQQAWANTHADAAVTAAKRQDDINAHKPLPGKDANGNDIMQFWDTDQQKYVVPAGLTGTPPGGKWMVGDNNTSARVVVYDAQGNVISDKPNTAFQPGTTVLTPDTVSPTIHTLQQQADGSYQLVSVPNDQQLTVSQAMMNVLVPDLAKAMTSKDMSAATAKDLVTEWNQKVQNDISAKNSEISAGTGATTAANDTLTQLNQGATTGAGLLKDRVDQTQESLRSWQSAAGQNKNLGLGTQLGPDFGSNLVNGLGDWATQMGGGQGVYDNAVKAVAAINPDDPHSAPSYATLSQMQQRFKDLAGVPHPTEGPSTQTPVQTPGAPAAPSPWQRADAANTADVDPTTGLARPGMAGTVAPGSPNYLGFQAPQAPGMARAPGMMPNSNTDAPVRGPVYG